jgi:hypothetical protein
MSTTAFDPDRATGTLIFTHGTRLTPAIRAVLGALAFNGDGADPSNPELSFSGEMSATWGVVLEHLQAQGREVGIEPPADTESDQQVHWWLRAHAQRVGAHPADIGRLLGTGKLALAQLAPVVDLVAVAKLLDDGHGLQGYRIEEYSVNVTDGQCHPWNPFDWNFPSLAAAEQAAEQYLLEENSCTEAVIGKVVIVDNEMQTDDDYDNLATIRRADLLEDLAAPAL